LPIAVKNNRSKINSTCGWNAMPKVEGEGEGNEGTVKTWLGELYGSTQP
jgi:hypothetical protein